MSASAENLNTENASSVNLVNLLDQSFSTTSKSTTALPNNISSPKCNDRYYSESVKSYSSETNKKIKSDFLSNHFENSNEELDIYSSENIDIIMEENNSLSENINNYSNSNYMEIQESFNSKYLDSPQQSIAKRALKRSYSFSDLNVRNILCLNKKHGSVHTFISTNATVSVEFENTNYDSNNYLETKIFEPLNNTVTNSCNKIMKLLNHERTDDSDLMKKENYPLEYFDSEFQNDCSKDTWDITNILPEKHSRIGKGDDQSEINDLQFGKEETELEFVEIEAIHSKESNYLELFEKIVTNPFFLTGVVLTGIIILVPSVNKISDWLSNSLSESPPPEPIPIIKPLGPEFLFASPLPPIKLLENDFASTKTAPLKTSFFYDMIRKSFKQINSYLSDRFRKL